MKNSKSDDESKINLSRKLDGLILLNSLDNLSGKERLNIITRCIGLREAARIIGRDAGNFSRSVKNKGKDVKKDPKWKRNFTRNKL